MQHSGVLLIIASAFGFSTLGIFGKLAFEQGLDSQSTLFWRFLFASVLLWTFLLLRGRQKIELNSLGIAFALGAVGFTVQVLLYFAALEQLAAGLTSLLLYTYTIHVVLLAWLVDREKPSRVALGAMGLAFLGIVLATDLSGRVSLLGVAIALFTGFWYAVYLTYSAKAVRRADPLVISGGLFLGATCTLGAILVFRGNIDVPQGLQGWGLILGISTLATVLPVVTLYAGLARLSTTRVSLLSTLEPVFTVAMGVLLLGERLSPVQVVGGALVLSAVVLLQRK